MQTQPPTTRPYGRHVLVCSGGSCASTEESSALRAGVKAELGALVKLRNPERVKWTLSDCLGVCAGGPIVVVYPDGIWYHHVDAMAMRRIVQEHLIEGRPVAELVFHRLYPEGQPPAYAPDVRGDAGSFSLVSTKASTVSADVSSQPQESTSRNAEEREAYRVAVRRAKSKKGLVIVNTGDGKGKTTAALGILTRAWGRNMRVGLLQFLKRDSSRVGEILALEKMGVKRIGLGDGWTWTSADLDESAARAVAGWKVAQQHILSGDYEVLVLDEFTYPLHYRWLDTQQVIRWLKDNKPPELHLIVTGRNAEPELVAFADLVTEMRNVKHPFELQGIRAQRGIEY